jgi:hypothetical protein
MQEGCALGDLKFEGMKLPRFKGDENESFALYQRKCVQYFAGMIIVSPAKHSISTPYMADFPIVHIYDQQKPTRNIRNISQTPLCK